MFVYEPFDFEKEFARARNGKRLPAKVRAPVVRYKTLLAMKRTAGRGKDLLDIEQLKKIDPYR